MDSKSDLARCIGSVSGDMKILIKSMILETKNPVLFIV